MVQPLHEDSDHSGFYFFLKKYALKNYLFLWLRQVWVEAGRFVAAGRLLSLRCVGLAALRDVGSQFSDQGSNLRPLLCEVDSSPLGHQGSPWVPFLECLAPLGISVQPSRCSQLLTVGIISPVFQTRPQAERGDVCGSEPRWQSWQSQPPAAGGRSRGLWGAGKDPRVGWVLADTADAK